MAASSRKRCYVTRWTIWYSRQRLAYGVLIIYLLTASRSCAWTDFQLNPCSPNIGAFTFIGPQHVGRCTPVIPSADQHCLFRLLRSIWVHLGRFHLSLVLVVTLRVRRLRHGQLFRGPGKYRSLHLPLAPYCTANCNQNHIENQIQTWLDGELCDQVKTVVTFSNADPRNLFRAYVLFKYCHVNVNVLGSSQKPGQVQHFLSNMLLSHPICISALRDLLHLL